LPLFIGKRRRHLYTSHNLQGKPIAALLGYRDSNDKQDGKGIWMKGQNEIKIHKGQWTRRNKLFCLSSDWSCTSNNEDKSHYHPEYYRCTGDMVPGI
jgi:hypothetical protein